MEMTMIGWLHQLGTLEFWEALLEGFLREAGIYLLPKPARHLALLAARRM